MDSGHCESLRRRCRPIVMLSPLSRRHCAVAILSHRCCHPSRQLCSVGAIEPVAVIAAVFVVMLGHLPLLTAPLVFS